MTEPLITVLPIAPVALGGLAELNLMRIFLRERMDGRRGGRARTSRETARPRRAPSVTTAWPMTRPAVAACFAIPALLGTTALGQEYASGTGSDARAAGAMSIAPAALSFAQQSPQAAGEQPTPAAEEKPLTISTNRPSFTDTTGFVPIGHFQLEMGYTFTLRDRDGVQTQTHNGPEVLFRVPLIDDRLELQFGTSGYVYSRTDDGTTSGSVDGFSDMTVGARLKVVDENGWVPRVCLQLVTTIGTGSDDISNQDVEPVLKLIWSYDLGKGWSIYGNFGVGYLTAGSDRFTQGQGGVCVGYTINNRWSVYGEYYMFGPNTKGSDAAHYADVGAAYLITPRIQLDARVGCGLNEEANNFFTGAGISFLF